MTAPWRAPLSLLLGAFLGAVTSLAAVHHLGWRHLDVGAEQALYEQVLEAHLRRLDRVHQGLRPRWLLLGDSHLQAFPVALLPGTAANFAIGGEPISRLADRVPGYQHVIHAQIWVIDGGSNDLRQGASVEDVLRAWRRVIALPPTEAGVVCLGLFPRRRAELASITRRREINRGIAEICAARNAAFIDPYEALAGSDLLLRPPFDDGDGVHVSGAAYRLLAEHILRAAATTPATATH